MKSVIVDGIRISGCSDGRRSNLLNESRQTALKLPETKFHSLGTIGAVCNLPKCGFICPEPIFPHQLKNSSQRKTALRILAIESSERLAQVALYDDFTSVAETAMEVTAPKVSQDPSAEFTAQKSRLSSSRSLVPQIQTLLRSAQWKMREVELICVTVGPGSFTGLRIGVVTAKSLCYAVGAKIVGVPTLEVVARQTQQRMSLSAGRTIKTILNAQRQQVFCSQFKVNAEGNLAGDGVVEILDRTEWLAAMQPEDVVSGSGLKSLVPEISGSMADCIAPNECWSPTASMVAKIGFELANQGRDDDLWSIQPKYYRPSYAES